MAQLIPTFEELQGTTDQELRDRYDVAVKAGQSYEPSFYIEELRRRDSDRREQRMLWLTWAIAILTVANVVAVLVDVFK